jgi:hypothetical protein
MIQASQPPPINESTQSVTTSVILPIQAHYSIFNTTAKKAINTTKASNIVPVDDNFK